MDGVLEATLTLYGCKVLCSLLCLPAFKDSLSCVSLCCSCLLLFTDISITMFLLYLWSAVPRPMFFHSSSDVIALRFMLFLSNMYKAVLLLTPLLVTMEMLFRLLWSRESTPSITAGNRVTEDKEIRVEILMDADGDVSQIEPRHIGEQTGSSGDSLKALGFLGCLLLWGICGTYAVLSWRKEQGMVTSCLEGGRLLSACLPCLLTASSPIQGQLFWALPAAGLLLALNAVLSLLGAKLAPKFAREGKVICAEPYAFQLAQTPQPRLERTVILGVIWGVGSNHADGSCSVYSSEYKKQSWAYGEPEAFAWSTQMADRCKLKSPSATFITPQQTLCPHQSGIWEAQRESPSLRVELMTGLMCWLLVCIFPTVLSTNVLLVSNLDAVAVYVLKHLLTPVHGK